MMRTNGFYNRCSVALAVALSLFHLYTGAVGPFPNIIQRAIHVGFGLAICFLLSAREKKFIFTFINFALAIGSLAICWYVVFHYDRISQATFVPRKLDLILGFTLTLIIIEASRRVIGWFLPALALISLIYAYFGPYFPGIWMHRGLSLRFMIEVLFTSTRGIWGIVTGISATVIAIFVIFGSVLFGTGGGTTFMNLAIWTAGQAYGGGAKISTIASSLFGTISGSAGANVATTGTFTIPLMKRLGYEANFAAGVECSASTGGQIMPPIMGAGAFIMAELLGIPYIRIAAAAIIPALLFYLGVYAGIHFEAKKKNYKGLNAEEIPQKSEIFDFYKLILVFAPLAVLIYYLVQGYTPFTAGFWAVITSILLFFVLEKGKFKEKIRKTFEIFARAGKGMVTVIVLIVCAQVILAMIAVSGVGVKFSSMIIELGKDNLWIALICAMVVSVILGMGLPTSGAYLLCAAVVAPALIRIGVEPLSAHFFVFFFAIFAGITPPVCGTVYIGSSIADSNWVKTALIALRLSFAAFIIPFIFVYNPTLLLIGTPLKIIWNSLTASLGVLAASAAIIGYLFKQLTIIERAFYLAGGLLLISPSLSSDIVGIVCALVPTLSQFIRKKDLPVHA